MYAPYYFHGLDPSWLPAIMISPDCHPNCVLNGTLLNNAVQILGSFGMIGLKKNKK